MGIESEKKMSKCFAYTTLCVVATLAQEPFSLRFLRNAGHLHQGPPVNVVASHCPKDTLSILGSGMTVNFRPWQWRATKRPLFRGLQPVTGHPVSDFLGAQTEAFEQALTELHRRAPRCHGRVWRCADRIFQNNASKTASCVRYVRLSGFEIVLHRAQIGWIEHLTTTFCGRV